MQSNLTRLRSHMARRRARLGVTLVVYGWHESQPGTLAWPFPSLGAALRGVHALRNAVCWLIVDGHCIFDENVDVDALRRAGGVLLERAV
jgi:hypothetical protein